MNNRLNKKMLILLSMLVIGCILVFTSCNRPRDWEEEKIVTDYGDCFEHFYRCVSSTFELGDLSFEHRILFDGNEILTYESDKDYVMIDYIYNEEITVYDMHGRLIYRHSGEDTFQLLPLDTNEKKFYPAYYQLMRRGDLDVIEMLLLGNDKYAQKIVLSYASNDFSEAEKHSIDITPSTAKILKIRCAELMEEYNLSDTK